MKFRNEATKDLPEPYQEWYVNPYLDTIYRLDMTGHNPTYMKSRIHLLYQLVEKNIMPWMWDTDNYSDDNKDMYGFFYPEDLYAYLQVANLRGERKEKK